MKFRRLFAALGFAAAVAQVAPAQAVTFGQLVSTTKAPATSVFSSVEVRVDNAPQFSAWQNIVRGAKSSLQACLANPGSCPGGFGQSWRAMMHSAQGRGRTEQVQLVNSFFNRLTYRTDAQEYGRPEHWATPVEFMSRGAGDCEDYATAKFFSLKLLGVADQDLRVVAVNDQIQRIGHAVLTVSINGTRHVLDNRTDQVFPESRYTFYQPLVSMNEAGPWRNLQQQAKQMRNVSSALTFR